MRRRRLALSRGQEARGEGVKGRGKGERVRREGDGCKSEEQSRPGQGSGDDKGDKARRPDQYWSLLASRRTSEENVKGWRGVKCGENELKEVCTRFWFVFLNNAFTVPAKTTRNKT